MAPKAPRTKKIGQKSITERLDNFAQDPDAEPELLEESRSAWDRAKQSYGFDKASTLTQNRRKRHLAEYENFLTGVAKKEGKEVDDEYLWGAERVEQNLRAYIAFAAAMISPRSYRSESIKFQTLVQRRQSMIYWVNLKCMDVENKAMWNASQEALYHSFRLVNSPTEASEKLYMTKYDLVKLIEFDMYATPNPDVSQQQHLAWLLGFVCGVRPGSIAVARTRDGQFLQWKDVQIYRAGGRDSMNFQAKVTFRWLKGHRDDQRKRIKFTCAGPRAPEDAMYSIPHRLLAVLLRRGLLKNYKTMNELLSDDKKLIAIKDEAMDLPVVCAVGPKGVEVLLDKPASSAAISTYVQRRALDYGLPAGITHYAWRRSAGSAVAEAFGAQKAREFLSHDVASTTFETSYNQGIIGLDAMSVAMGTTPLSRGALLEDEMVVASRIQVETESRRAWIEKFVNDSEDYIAQKKVYSDAETKAANYPDDDDKQDAAAAEYRRLGLVRRTLQAQGRFAFQDVQLKLAKESITEAEFQNRRKDAKAAGKVQKMLLEAAADGRDKAMAMLEDGEAEVNDYDVDDLQDAENRLDDNDETSDEHEILVQSLSFEDTDPTPGTKPEVAAVAHACRTLMNVLVGQAESVKVEKPCHLCQLDPTVDQKMKDNVYMPAKLQVHQSWSFHSPKKAWLRRWKGSKNKCPYPDCDTQGTPEQLLAHVLERKGQSDQHLLAAARDGMFARDFDPKATATGEVSVKAVGGGKYKMVAPEDPTEVDIAAMIPPRNLSKDGEFLDEPQARAPVKNEPTLRLPTKTPLTQTAWWPEHETGIEGAVTDTLHAQQEFLMKLADKNLRDLGKGQANAKGETATRASHGKGKKRQEAIKHLRKRLVELGWRWGADTANQVDEEDEEEEFQGFPDDDDPDADGTVD